MILEIKNSLSENNIILIPVASTIYLYSFIIYLYEHYFISSLVVIHTSMSAFCICHTDSDSDSDSELELELELESGSM